jgi:hypothetical protein
MIKLGSKDIEIVPSTKEHVESLVKNIRPKDQAEIEGLGLSVKYACENSFLTGIQNNTAYMGYSGKPGLLTTVYANDVNPLTFAKVYRSEVKKMVKTFPVLINYVAVEYEEAIRLLRICGFRIFDDKPIAGKSAYYYKFSMGEQNENN